MPSPLIADLAASFRRHLRAAGKADRTLVLYGQSIRFFIEWLENQGRPATLDNLNRHTITAWLADLSEKVETETVRTRLRGMRRFCRWLEAEGEVDKAPTTGVEMPAPAEKPNRTLTDDELVRLIKACSRPRGRAGVWDRHIFDGRRDEVIIRFLADCGIRVSELAGLTVEDVDQDREIIYVTGKGNRPRVVPYGAKTGQALDRYLRMRTAHPKAHTTDRLILSERGPLSADGIRWRLEQVAAAAGVPDVHPHAFRHTAAHRWLTEGGSERGLMAVMGWRSDAMLSVYARSTQIERAHAEHRRLRLGDRL
ncbi:tyrosine-type recombinase/integrase [Micromonospora globbae]|uniref:Tyrosine-type recombinase/integrase n=1 Tax=Micromonospora globbae TaxID=1894969 RepID=A0ABZ1RZB4_9ACTN|nr:tyrosine-type recombinase/integrase [Micromonospora globbae]